MSQSSELSDITALQLPAEGFSLGHLLLIVIRRRKSIATFTLAAGLLATSIAFLLPRYYTATTTLMPPQQSHSLANALLSQLGALPQIMASETGIKDPNDIFIAILQSRSIADALIAQYDLKSVYHKRRPEDMRESLSHATTIKSAKGGVIVLSVEDRDANRAAAIANSYVSEMYKLNSHMATAEGAQRRAFFDQQLKIARDELQNSEEALRKTQQSSGIVQLDAQAKGIVEGTVALQAQVAAKEVQVRAMQSFATDQNADLKRAQSELAAQRAQLAQLENHPRALTLDVPTSKLPAAAMEYMNRVRDVKYNEAVVEAIGKQYEIARLDEAKSAPIVQVIDPALPPTKSSRPNRVAIILVSMMSAFVMAASWAFGQDSYRSNPARWPLVHILLGQR